MGLRYLGNINKPGYNPLASNITTSPNTVQYQGVFTLQQQAQAITTGQWATDPLFDYSTLLLQADNIANGSQNNTFLDSSTNNFSITRNGNTTQGTFTPFSLQNGAWSNYFDGTSNSYITAPDNAAYDVGTGDFVLEGFVYLTASTDFGVIAGQWGIPRGYALRQRSGKFQFVYVTSAAPSTEVTLDSTTSYSLNTWYHVAIIRTGSTFGLFVNGTREATATASPTINNSTDVFSVGRAGNAADYTTGYITNVRLVKGSNPSGYSASSSTLTVPSSPLTAVTGTSILTSQSNRFIDNSSTAATLTTASGTSVQPFSPFAPQYQWTSSVIGGSGYFDGTGDYVTAPANAAYAMGTGDFTIECWFNTALTGARYIFDMRPSGTQAIGAYVSSSSLYVNNGSTLDILASSAFVLGAWNHFAYVRSGSGTNNVSIFLNGSRVYQRTDTTNYSTNPIVYIGTDNTGSYSNGGYISGFRILKGTAQYSGATYTIPTAPPTAITNTSLLLNFTNAGIYDGTMKNDLETVGNAQISTSVVKYGSGSMYFDGNGDYLRPNSGNIFNFGTGDFTVEFWLYLNATTAQTFIDCRPGSAGDYILFDYDPTLRLYVGSTTVLSGKSLSTGQWYHIALARSGSTVKYFVNGVQEASATMTTNLLSASNPYIGSNYVPGAYLNGYIDDMRITKGVARYITSFTPPLVALPRQ